MKRGTLSDWFAACECGDASLLADLLRVNPGWTAAADAAGETGLHKAAYYGDAAAVQLLLDAGCVPAAVNPDGQSPLHLAARGDAGRAIRALAAGGGNIDLADRQGRTPLMLAAGVEATAALLESQAALHLSDLRGRTALHHAVLRLSETGLEPLRLLLQAKSNAVAPDRDGNTPLHLDHCGGAVWLLVGAGARVNALNRDGASPLELAIRRGALAAVQGLINAGASTGAGRIREALEAIAPVPSGVAAEIREVVSPSILKLRTEDKSPRGEAAGAEPEVIRLLSPEFLARRNRKK